MGIVNVTPDSFSDGGLFVEPSAAVEHGRRLLAEGAALVDVGGESTRPGARPVSADEELRGPFLVARSILGSAEARAAAGGTASAEALDRARRQLEAAAHKVGADQAMISPEVVEYAEWLTLARYLSRDFTGARGLALRVVSETIRELFGGSIGDYLEYASAAPGVMVGGLRQLLGVQMQRLSDGEQELLRRLAVEREPVGIAELAADLGPRIGRAATLEAAEGVAERKGARACERRHEDDEQPARHQQDDGEQGEAEADH